MNFVPPSKPEGVRRGMNNMPKQAKDLPPEVCQLIQNGYPGPLSYPRHGMTDEIYSTTQLGYDTENSLFRPNGCIFRYGGKEFILAWAQSTEDLTEYHLECWNITDGNRTRILQLDMPNNDEYFGMQALYDAVYITLEHEATANRTNSAVTKNIILEYDSGSWTVRDVMITIAPSMSAISAKQLGTVVNTFRPAEKAVVWRNQIWAVGASEGGYCDLWRYNGSKWILETTDRHPDLGFQWRQNFTLLVHDDYLYVIGGYATGGPTYYNDCWRYDGTSWTRLSNAVSSAGFYNHAALSYNGDLYVIGGVRSGTPCDDVYKSTDDGENWSLVNGACAFGILEAMGAAVFDGKMWVIGGWLGASSSDDVYSSTDGDTWTLEAGEPGFSARTGMATIVYNNKLWIVAGHTSLSSQPTIVDVYSTEDGATWTQETLDGGYTPRLHPSGFVFNSEMWLFLGDYAKDAFTSTGGEIWTVHAEQLAEGKFKGYTFSFVRRTDDASTLSSYSGYVYQPWETVDGATVVGPDEVLLTGTVQVNSGGGLVGTDTDFANELSVGDYIRIDGAKDCYRIESITDANNAAIDDTDLETLSGMSYALMPAVGDHISTNVWHAGVAEGIEDSDERQIIESDVNPDQFATPVLPMPSNATTAILKGATHVRVWSTTSQVTRALAEEVSLRYTIDIAIDADNFDASKLWVDRMTDDTLAGETNSLEVTGYEPPPNCRYLYWDSTTGLMWAYGDPDNEGFAYFSTQEIGDTANPQKFASWFKTATNFIRCNPADGTKGTGIVSLVGDLYLFKEYSIFVLDNGKPSNAPRQMSHTIGCICPQSLRVVDLPKVSGFAVFFISNKGPMILLPGGRLEPFWDFTVSQLWPDGEIHENSNGTPTDWHSRNKVWVSMHGNGLWVFYGDREDSNSDMQTNRIWGYWFGDDKTTHGPLEITIPAAPDIGYGAIKVNEPQMLFSLDDVRGYTLSHASDDEDNAYWRCVRFLDPTAYQDTYHVP